MKLKLIGSGVVLLGALLVGCGGSSSSNLPSPMIRFVNTSPDTNLDLAVDDDTLFTNESSATSTSVFKSLGNEIKERDFSIVETGSSVSLDALSATLARDSDTLAIAYGTKANGTETEKRLRLSLLTVNRRVPNGSKARVICANGLIRSAGNTAFPVIFRNPVSPALVSTLPVAYGETTVIDVDAGPTDLVAQRQSTEFTVASVTKNFEAGKVYLMVLSGLEGGTGASAPAIRFVDIQTRN